MADDMGLGKTLQCVSLIWTLVKVLVDNILTPTLAGLDIGYTDGRSLLRQFSFNLLFFTVF